MKREILKDLVKWKNSSDRRPLVLKGARQVGKTYILELFGDQEFGKYHIFNFEKDSDLKKIFSNGLSPEKIISDLSFRVGRRIDINNDLVIFDEIQECSRALTSLKYFCEEIPELALACAGSLLGVKLSSESFPVGKVDFLRLFPMNFKEFLMVKENEMLLNAFNQAAEGDDITETAHEVLWEELKNYYFVGGMPAVVLTYIKSMRDGSDRFLTFKKVRKVQEDLVNGFNNDFAKHSGKINSISIVSVFENIPLQLSSHLNDSVKRYRFKDVIPRKNGFGELNGPIEWLNKAGLVIKIGICNKAELPMKSFCKDNTFKLHVFDIGLLGQMLDLPAEAILQQNYGMQKGYLAESFVAQEFTASGEENLVSWMERNSEIEFLRYFNGEIVPVEVKSSTRTQAKSLRQFILKYSPGLAIKISANILNLKGQIKNVPLYLSGEIQRVLRKI